TRPGKAYATAPTQVPRFHRRCGGRSWQTRRDQPGVLWIPKVSVPAAGCSVTLVELGGAWPFILAALLAVAIVALALFFGRSKSISTATQYTPPEAVRPTEPTAEHVVASPTQITVGESPSQPIVTINALPGLDEYENASDLSGLGNRLIPLLQA